ncbi:MAG: type VI secretion system tip protein VgrG, partial [Proteobacteria bacterium]|nr:type VI secretion system tip protein VgrG [Pseudomonadota bacterium]
MTTKQDTYLSINTPLDETVKRGYKFQVISLQGSEGLCLDFVYKIRLCSPERLTVSDIEKLVGKRVTLGIGFSDHKLRKSQRYINGLVFKLTEIGLGKTPLMTDLWQYEIEVSSWFKTLNQIKECRIFQKGNNNSVSIVSELLREYGFQDFRFEINSSLPTRPYSVLYNESIANYVKRILLEDGIFWRYEHSENKHVLVFHDDSGTLPEIPVDNMAGLDAVKSFQKRSHHNPTRDFERASFNWLDQPVKKVKGKTAVEKGNLGHFEYIPNFQTKTDGEKIVSRLASKTANEKEIYEGESTVRMFASGYHFTLTAPALNDVNGKSFLLNTLEIEATQTSYKNTFTASPKKQLFYPAEDEGIEKPRILGPQTAIVVGEGGNDHVRTQEQGCVKVRFHWDHLSPADDKHTSAFIRIGMPGAGDHRGMLFVPRIGEEVVVDYEDGNPDKPLIIGSVYSRHNPPPIKPESNPYTSIIRNSSDKDSNQLTFYDNPGQENLELVAKKNMTIDVSNDFNIDAVNNINIKARSVFIVTKDTINVVAGNNIENTSLATIINLGLAAIMNTACANIMDLALGVVLSKSGGLYSQLAGGIIANTSVLGIEQASKNIVESTSQALLLNTASAVVNSGGGTVKTKAGLAILNNASEKIHNESDKKTNKISLVSMSESKNAAVKG